MCRRRGLPDLSAATSHHRRAAACVALPPTLFLALLLSGCGAGPVTDYVTVGDCAAHTLPPPGERLPPCINTERGVMPLEDTYIAGVVQCEMAPLTTADAALEAQAIAARTYLAAYLERKGPDVEIPIGPRFQCWKPAKLDRAIAAAVHTSGTVLQVGDGSLLNANYVSGARKRTFDCDPLPPKAQGYKDYDTWDAMRAEYIRRRKARIRARFGGVSWTEVVVTRNEGKRGPAVQGTPMASVRPTNRGAFGQYASVCLAENLGYETADILRYFFGDDIGFSRPLLPPSIVIEGEE